MVDYQILLCEDFQNKEEVLLGELKEEKTGQITLEDVKILSKYLHKDYPDNSSIVDEEIADINGDGKVDEKDLKLLMEISQKTRPYQYKKEYVLLGDLDGDGEITINDLALLLNYVKNQIIRINSNIMDMKNDYLINGEDKSLLSDIVNSANKILSYNDKGELLGDFDGDGELTVKDLTAFQKYLNSLAIPDSLKGLVDLNENGEVEFFVPEELKDLLEDLNEDEKVAIEELIDSLKGIVDLNRDGKVDFSDLEQLKKLLTNPTNDKDDKNRLLGDLDRDGKITDKDIGLLDNYLKGLANSFMSFAKEIADVNNDGVVDELDVTLLKQIILGKQPIQRKTRMVLLGDFDGDGRVTEKDVVALSDYLLKNSKIEVDEKIADINGDGVVDEKDLKLLIKMFNGTESYQYQKNSFSEKPVCELGSSTSNFFGKAINPIFYTKIDGTHELSFSLPSHYLDTETGEMLPNDLVKHVSNKSKIRLIKNPGENQETFHLIVNSKTDKDDDGLLTYNYSCSDAFIEELSKTGYSLSFGEEVGQGGLGTIHELASEILKGTNWKYIKENTGTLYEYSTELKYNIDQGRYDTVYIPKPSHNIKFIPELKRYCYVLEPVEVKDGISRHIYCYEDTEQIVSTTEKNLIYNGKDFVDLSGWDNFRRDGNGKPVEGLTIIPYVVEPSDDDETPGYDKDDELNKYYMKITSSDARRQTYLLNTTAAASGSRLEAYQPYLLKIDTTSKGKYGKIRGIQIYDKNPLLNPDADPVYQKNVTGKESDLSDGRFYPIVLGQDISSPYVVFNVVLDDQNKTQKRMYIKQFCLFKVIGKASDDASAEENNLYLAQNLLDTTEAFSADADIMSRIVLPLGVLEKDDDAISAYTLEKVRYFSRDNYKIEAGEEVQIDNLIEETVTYISSSVLFDGENIVEVSQLPDEDIDKDKIYHLNSDNKYYQYYSIDGRNGEWGLALLGNGKNDKTRTLKAEKTNRFNLLQELSELFKVWCVFHIHENEDGSFERQIWFKEKAINENFSGFHKGINLRSIERKSESMEVVTKIFVEDVENEFAENGFVTIREAKTNPWGENYYYNFKYYVDQQLCVKDNEGVPYIEKDLQELYTSVKGLNSEIIKLNKRVVNSNLKLAELLRNIKSLSYQIAAADSRIASINGEQEKENITKEKQDQLSKDLKNMKAKRKTYFDQRAKIQESYDILNEQYTCWSKQVEDYQKEKTILISNFERRYSQFIKEGVWSDSSYVDANSYYYDSQKVANTSAMPATSWAISVLDGSVIEELEDYKFSVGDMTFLVDNEFFDVEENAEENYTFEVLVSGIREYFDEPEKNEIELRNYLTSFEDLFQRISAAAQTLSLKEQVYDKAANFTSQGEIDKDILQKTLSDNNLVLANASDNSYLLDDSGLTLQSIINPIKKTRILAEGIFISNSLNFMGEPEWKTGITADGINASILTAGEINTAKIKIYAEGQPNQTWDALGITSYQMTKNEEDSFEVDPNRFVRFDNFGFYFVNEDDGLPNWNYDDAGAPWFKGLSRETAIQQIVDNAVLSVTENGFNINANYSSTLSYSYRGEIFGFSTAEVESLKIGKIRTESYEDNGKTIYYDVYGFSMQGNVSFKNAQGEEVSRENSSVEFRNDGEHRINNWLFSGDGLSVKGDGWLIGGKLHESTLSLTPGHIYGTIGQGQSDAISFSTFNLGSGIEIRNDNWNFTFGAPEGMNIFHWSSVTGGIATKMLGTYYNSDKSYGIKIRRALVVGDQIDGETSGFTGWRHTLAAGSGLTIKHNDDPFLETPNTADGSDVYLKVHKTIRADKNLKVTGDLEVDGTAYMSYAQVYNNIIADGVIETKKYISIKKDKADVYYHLNVDSNGYLRYGSDHYVGTAKELLNGYFYAQDGTKVNVVNGLITKFGT